MPESQCFPRTIRSTVSQSNTRPFLYFVLEIAVCSIADMHVSMIKLFVDTYDDRFSESILWQSATPGFDDGAFASAASEAAEIQAQQLPVAGYIGPKKSTPRCARLHDNAVCIFVDFGCSRAWQIRACGARTNAK